MGPVGRFARLGGGDRHPAPESYDVQLAELWAEFARSNSISIVDFWSSLLTCLGVCSLGDRCRSFAEGDAETGGRVS